MTTSHRPASLLLLLGLGLSLAPTAVRGHGFLTTPHARNADDSCAHCLNAGDPGTVNADGAYTHGMCGNKKDDSPQHWNEASETTINLGQSGDSVLLEVTITAHHMGYFEFEICDSPNITEECFRSRRLLRSNCDPDEEGEMTCRRWWKPLKPDEYNHYSLTPQGYPDGAPYTTGCNYVTYGAYYDLPDDLSCTHCVLRWHWYTTNSCTGGANAVGEEFWNCADVSIDAPDGQITVDTTPLDYDALNAALAAHVPEDLSGVLTDDDNWQCPDPAYGTAGEYFCGAGNSVNGTELCYAPTAGEECTVSYYESSIEPIEEGTPAVSYCTWSGVCLADGEGGSDWCDTSEENCANCGGDWCVGLNDLVSTTTDMYGNGPNTTTTTTTMDSGPGYCAWFECNGSSDNEWCDAEQANCEGACNGVWCPTDGDDGDDSSTTTTDMYGDGDDSTESTTTSTFDDDTTTSFAYGGDDSTTTTEDDGEDSTTTTTMTATTDSDGGDDDDCCGGGEEVLSAIESLNNDVATLTQLVQSLKTMFERSECAPPPTTTAEPATTTAGPATTTAGPEATTTAGPEATTTAGPETTTTPLTCAHPDLAVVADVYDLGPNAQSSDFAPWILVDDPTGEVQYRGEWDALQLRNAAAGDSYVQYAVEGSAAYEFFTVSASVLAKNLDANPDTRCLFEVSVDGGASWLDDDDALLVLVDGDDDAVPRTASDCFQVAAGPTMELHLRMRTSGNNYWDTCALVEVHVQALDVAAPTAPATTTMPNYRRLRLRG